MLRGPRDFNAGRLMDGACMPLLLHINDRAPPFILKPRFAGPELCGTRKLDLAMACEESLHAAWQAAQMTLFNSSYRPAFQSTRVINDPPRTGCPAMQVFNATLSYTDRCRNASSQIAAAPFPHHYQYITGSILAVP